MRRGILIGIVAAGAALFGATGASLAATPEEIYKDLADNGCLNGSYTQAELDAFAKSATVQGYGSQVLVVRFCAPPAAKTEKTEKTEATANVGSAPPPPADNEASEGVAGAQSPSQQPVSTPAGQPAAAVAQQPLQETAQAQTLPFTGSELAIFAFVGTALLLGGFALRASARGR